MVHFGDNLIGQILHNTTCYIANLYGTLATAYDWMAHYCHQVYRMRSALSGVHVCFRHISHTPCVWTHWGS